LAPERELKVYNDFSNLASIVGAQKWVPTFVLAKVQKAAKETQWTLSLIFHKG